MTSEELAAMFRSEFERGRAVGRAELARELLDGPISILSRLLAAAGARDVVEPAAGRISAIRAPAGVKIARVSPLKPGDEIREGDRIEVEGSTEVVGTVEVEATSR